MVRVVKELAANPLNRSLQQTVSAGGYETALLEKTLQKIGTLLSIGFGAAGAEIIGKNLANNGDLDAMIAGKKVTAIYGFCDIRQFTDTTECLQEDVMVFVNRIGKIVHGATHQFSGSANKNIGDAFLLVWKLRCDPLKPESWNRDPDVVRMADNAISAFLKIIVDTENSNQNGILSTYSVREDVLKRFGPGYKVRMGFGLHIGWSIEGVLGTTYKIDASYLSAHVNMSGKLEESTKEFAVPLLISGDLHRCFSNPVGSKCRRLDRVIIAGKTYDYYTFDITNIPESLGEPPTVDFLDFAKDPMVAALHEGINPKFFPIHAQAVDAYIAGTWDIAKKKCDEALELWPDDGPTLAIMHYMEDTGFKAPNDWVGARDISSFKH
jgi:class 3 adenylate cyclase